MSKTNYDVIIVGSGPAGLTAALYTGRAGLKTLIFEEENLGGALPNIEIIENWPGVEQGIMGAELAGLILGQVMAYEPELRVPVRVQGAEALDNDLLEVRAGEETFIGKTLLLTGGTRPRTLGIPGEEGLTGRGVHYCVMCDGASYAGQDVALLGGGDSGVTGALYMARLGCRVHLIELAPRLGACTTLRDRLAEHPEIEVHCSTTISAVEEGLGRRLLKVKDLTSGRERDLSVDGLFILAGRIPQTEHLRDLVELDEDGSVRVDQGMSTSRPGVFAAGDIRSGSIMQIVSAAGDGATAAVSAEKYINERSW